MSDAPASHPPASGQVELGYVAGVHGVHGQLRVKLHAATTEPLVPGVALFFRQRGGGPVSAKLELVECFADRQGRAEVRLVLAGITTREQAEALKSHGLWIAREDLPALDDDEYYLHDLIGLEAQHARVDLALGKVTGIVSTGAQDLLELLWRDEAGRKHSWLCPAMPGFVIEASATQLSLDPAPGLMPDTLDAQVEALEAGDAPASE